MDRLVDFLISNLQPAVDAIKIAAPDVIQREVGWIVWASTLEYHIGIWLLVFSAACLAVILLGCLAWEWGDYHLGIVSIFVVLGGLALIAGIICTIDGKVTLKHLEINPTYVLLKHFMPGD